MRNRDRVKAVLRPCLSPTYPMTKPPTSCDQAQTRGELMCLELWTIFILLVSPTGLIKNAPPNIANDFIKLPFSSPGASGGKNTWAMISIVCQRKKSAWYSQKYSTLLLAEVRTRKETKESKVIPIYFERRSAVLSVVNAYDHPSCIIFSICLPLEDISHNTSGSVIPRFYDDASFALAQVCRHDS